MGRAAKTAEPLPATRRFVPIAYRVHDAALLIGLSESRMWELIAEGAVPAKKLGGATVIRHDDLYSYVEDAPPSGPARKAAQ